MRRTIVNCLLMGVLLIASAVFFSCREHLYVVQTTPQMDLETKFWVRVLLADDVPKCTLQVRGGFSVLDSYGRTLVPETIFTEFGEPMEVTVSAAGIIIAGRSFPAMEVTILPDDPHSFSLDDNEYRGKLVLKANLDYTTLDAINVVPLEPYLAGVVGAEMPAYWSSEALKAQAIAARTYCLYQKMRFGAARHWDVTRTTASQVYGGMRAESSRVWKAVNNTTGQVLVCTQSSGTEEIFPTYYSSSCGGHTEDANNVFGDSFAPLRGVVCPYCKDVARPNTFFWPMVEFDKTSVQTALQVKYPKLSELEDITAILPVRQSNYPDFSRLTFIKLFGSTGKSDFLRAEDLRLTIDPTGNKIRSTSCTIIKMDGPGADSEWVFSAGRGFGHAVGMCQCGAEGMARQGKSAEQILSYYYPGSKLIRVY
ncbi:MAG: SpoIID/LytB domain-containing protein [Planctomycetota bacterium]